MKKDTTCNQLCSVKLDEEDVKKFKWMIDEQYFVNL